MDPTLDPFAPMAWPLSSSSQFNDPFPNQTELERFKREMMAKTARPMQNPADYFQEMQQRRRSAFMNYYDPGRNDPHIPREIKMEKSKVAVVDVNAGLADMNAEEALQYESLRAIHLNAQADQVLHKAMQRQRLEKKKEKAEKIGVRPTTLADSAKLISTWIDGDGFGYLSELGMTRRNLQGHDTFISKKGQMTFVPVMVVKAFFGNKTKIGVAAVERLIDPIPGGVAQKIKECLDEEIVDYCMAMGPSTDFKEGTFQDPSKFRHPDPIILGFIKAGKEPDPLKDPCFIISSWKTEDLS